MRQKIKSLCTLVLFSASVLAENGSDSLKQVRLEEVVVSSIRAGRYAPVPSSSINEQQIKKENAAKSIPYLLQTLPSVVSFSEDGVGVGNTSLRIRGVDASRINVTLNGMPLNNPVSQEVFWVNLPDISNSVQSIQVQRGVGTSTNGTAPMGGGISLNTVGGAPKAYGEINVSAANYNTYLYTLAGGSGVLKNGLSLDGRYSQVNGDGYIRNGKVDHRSLYLALSYYGSKDLFRLNYIHGGQHTGITWLGISPEQMAIDRRYNPAGGYTDGNGKTQYYQNETDNYYSDIFQASYSRFLSERLTFNANLSYNHGYGYYENYKINRKLKSYYGLSPQLVDGVSYAKSDAIHRKVLNNDFYVANVQLSYEKENLCVSGGAMMSLYDGAHYGRILWVKYNQNIPRGYEWYRNDDDKSDYHFFGKISYSPISRLSLFGDLQFRYVDFRMDGIDDDLTTIKSNNYFKFLNPKIGFSYRLDEHSRLGEIYASLSVANREPLRTDLKDGAKGKNDRLIQPERLYDYELGYRISNLNYAFNANFYYMDYDRQMVQTGRLSDVGYKLLENVDKSYRVGLELSGSYAPVRVLRLDGNIAFSQSKIKDYVAYFDNYLSDGVSKNGQVTESYKKTDISFSPDVIASAVITVRPTKHILLSLTEKYVGKQFLDNTSNDQTSIPEYFFTNVVATFSHKIKGIGEVELQGYVNNVFDKEYVANGMADASYVGGVKKYNIGYYPQAGRNFMGRLILKF